MACTLVGFKRLFMRGCHMAAMSGCVVARSLKPASTVRPEQYGQPGSALPLRARFAMRPDHSWPSLHFHQTRLLELAITSVGFRSPLRSLFHSLAILGCVVLRSL